MATKISVIGKNLRISGKFKEVVKYIKMLDECFPNITIPKLCRKLKFAITMLN